MPLPNRNVLVVVCSVWSSGEQVLGLKDAPGKTVIEGKSHSKPTLPRERVLC